MRKLILLSICAFLSEWANAADLKAVKNGNWNDVTVWGCIAGNATVDADGNGLLDANDNHTFDVKTGYSIDFSGYDPDGTELNNSITIRTGATLTVNTGTFNNNNVKIFPYNNATINANSDFIVYNIYIPTQTSGQTISITSGGTLQVTNAFYSNVSASTNITAQNVNFNTYNNATATDLTTTINITSAAGNVQINNYYDSNNSALTVNKNTTITNYNVAPLDRTLVGNNIDVTGNLTITNLKTNNATTPGFTDITASNISITNYNTSLSNINSSLKTKVPATGAFSVDKFYPVGTVVSNDLMTINSYSFVDGLKSIMNFNADVDIKSFDIKNNNTMKFNMAKLNSITFEAAAGTTLNLPIQCTILGGAKVYLPNGLTNADNYPVFIDGDVFIKKDLIIRSPLGISGYMFLTGDLVFSASNSGCSALAGNLVANGHKFKFMQTHCELNVFGNAYFSTVQFEHVNFGDGQTNIFVEKDMTITPDQNYQYMNGKYTVGGNTTISTNDMVFTKEAFVYLGQDIDLSASKTGLVTGVGGGEIKFNADYPDRLSVYTSNYKVCGNYTRDSLMKTFNGAALPISLIDFNYRIVPSGVELRWSTASETNNDFFNISKSINAKDFSVIGTISGAGTSSTTSRYAFVDTEPIHGLSYYRLSQTDFDGKNENFPLIAVNYFEGGNVSIYPTIVQQGSTIFIKTDHQQDYSVSMVNISGVSMSGIPSVPNAESIQLPVDIEPGLYLLKIIIGRESINQIITVY